MFRKWFKKLFSKGRVIYSPSTEDVRQLEEYWRNQGRLNRYYQRKAEEIFK